MTNPVDRIGRANRKAHALADRLGDEAIRYSLMITGAVSLWAVVHSFWAARSIREDLAAARVA